MQNRRLAGKAEDGLEEACRSAENPGSRAGFAALYLTDTRSEARPA